MSALEWAAWASVVVFLFAVGFITGGSIGVERGQERGYIRALVDMKQGEEPLYHLVTHSDGTVTWEIRKGK